MATNLDKPQHLETWLAGQWGLRPVGKHDPVAVLADLIQRDLPEGPER